MKAMLLAAGRGERMRPLTDRTPKPLLEAGGKALIVWLIEKLVRANIRELVINHAHLGTKIEAALGDGARFGASIRYSREERALETAGGIANALPLLTHDADTKTGCGEEPFAVINSDIYCDYDFARLTECAAALQIANDSAYLVLADNPLHHPDGDFYLEGRRVIPIEQARASGNLHFYNPDLRPLTFSGIGVYQPSFFKQIVRGSVAPLGALLRAQIALGKVGGEYHRGMWMDVGTPERLAALDELIRFSAPAGEAAGG